MELITAVMFLYMTKLEMIYVFFLSIFANLSTVNVSFLKKRYQKSVSILVFFFLFIFKLVCSFVFMHVCVPCACLCAWRLEEGIGSSATGVTVTDDGCETPCSCWEPNLSPLEEQPLLTTEPPLWFPFFN